MDASNQIECLRNAYTAVLNLSGGQRRGSYISFEIMIKKKKKTDSLPERMHCKSRNAIVWFRESHELLGVHPWASGLKLLVYCEPCAGL